MYDKGPDPSLSIWNSCDKVLAVVFCESMAMLDDEKSESPVRRKAKSVYPLIDFNEKTANL